MKINNLTTTRCNGGLKLRVSQFVNALIFQQDKPCTIVNFPTR